MIPVRWIIMTLTLILWNIFEYNSHELVDVVGRQPTIITKTCSVIENSSVLGYYWSSISLEHLIFVSLNGWAKPLWNFFSLLNYLELNFLKKCSDKCNPNFITEANDLRNGFIAKEFAPNIFFRSGGEEIRMKVILTDF